MKLNELEKAGSVNTDFIAAFFMTFIVSAASVDRCVDILQKEKGGSRPKSLLLFDATGFMTHGEQNQLDKNSSVRELVIVRTEKQLNQL